MTGLYYRWPDPLRPTDRSADCIAPANTDNSSIAIVRAKKSLRDHRSAGIVLPHIEVIRLSADRARCQLLATIYGD